MKAPLKPRRPSAEETLSIAATTAPRQPPAQVPEAAAESERDTATTLNLRVRMSTVRAIEATAKGQGLTMKQVVAFALRDAGVEVAEADLEDRTPRRR